VSRIRSVREKRYHYLRNYMPEQGFASLNRYKEKCFAVKPLMREMHDWFGTPEWYGQAP
jgi:hypothetical protein